MAEQQQDEVGPASALAWSKGSRASGGWRGHGRRARDATGRRRDLCGTAGPLAKWTAGKQADLAAGLSSLSHSKENKNKTEIRKKRKRG